MDSADHLRESMYAMAEEINRLRTELKMALAAIEGHVAQGDELRAQVEALKQDAERFRALFEYLNTHDESPWGMLEDSEYWDRLEDGEPLINVMRDAIDKALRNEGE